jgi:hypothetical protein
MEDSDIKLGNPHIVTIAVAKLGGLREPIDIEDIAIEAFNIAPTRFCWRKFPDRIDLRTIYDSLKDATRLDPPLLKGGARRGYMLTPEGKAWTEQIGEVDDKKVAESVRRFSQHEWIETERIRLKKTEAYKKWNLSQSESISLRDFQEFTRVNDYFPEHLREQRFLRMKNVVQDDEELNALLEYLLSTFAGVKS